MCIVYAQSTIFTGIHFLFINIACVALKNPHPVELKETTLHYCLYKKLEDRGEKGSIPHTVYIMWWGGGGGVLRGNVFIHSFSDLR